MPSMSNIPTSLSLTPNMTAGTFITSQLVFELTISYGCRNSEDGGSVVVTVMNSPYAPTNFSLFKQCRTCCMFSPATCLQSHSPLPLPSHPPPTLPPPALGFCLNARLIVIPTLQHCMTSSRDSSRLLFSVSRPPLLACATVLETACASLFPLCRRRASAVRGLCVRG